MPSTPGLSTMFTPAADLDHPVTMRHAGRELLSLALIDARNRSLRLFAAFEAAARPDALDGTPPPLQGSPLWWLGQLGWYQEHWIARNVQRHRGRRCDARGIRLASIDPRADLWWDPRLRSPVERGATDLPRAAAVRQYLADTLEVTLELLMEAPEQDETLYFYRDALFHEDRQAERLIEAAQMLDVPLPEATAPGAWVPHQPLAVSAGHWHIGIAPEQGGYVFESERGRRLDSCPDHDIDAQPVSWQQFLEFVADGGYRQSRMVATASRAGGARPAGTGSARSSAPVRSWQRTPPTVWCRPVSAAPSACIRTIPSSMSTCTRPRPGAAGPGAACPAKSSGHMPQSAWAAGASAGARSGNGPRTGWSRWSRTWATATCRSARPSWRPARSTTGCCAAAPR